MASKVSSVAQATLSLLQEVQQPLAWTQPAGKLEKNDLKEEDNVDKHMAVRIWSASLNLWCWLKQKLKKKKVWGTL